MMVWFKLQTGESTGYYELGHHELFKSAYLMFKWQIYKNWVPGAIGSLIENQIEVDNCEKEVPL